MLFRKFPASNIYIFTDGNVEMAGLTDARIGILKYDVPGFEDEPGTLGSTLRYMPLFMDTGHTTIWVLDIDIHDAFIDAGDLNRCPPHGSLFWSMVHYTKPWVDPHDWPIINHSAIFRNVRLHKSILNNFLKKIVHGKYAPLIHEINKHNLGRANKRTFTEEPLHPYGMDEYFTNNVLKQALKAKGFNVQFKVYNTLDGVVKKLVMTGNEAQFSRLLRALTDFYFQPNHRNEKAVLAEYVRNAASLQATTGLDVRRIKHLIEYTTGAPPPSTPA
jgi:hypothetical protein